MADQTGISWTDVTMNPWIGCEKISPGCAHCYAETLAEGRMGLQVWGPDAPRRIAAESTWKKPLAWNRESEKNGRERYGGTKDERIRVFCASMADVFEPRPDLDAPSARLFALIQETPALDWLLLTKRPDLAAEVLRRWYEQAGSHEGVSRDNLGWGVLPNIWIGTSIENTRFTWRADALREIPAAVRFISAEPLLGSLFDDRAATVTPGTAPDLDDALEGGVAVPGVRAPLDLSGIDWLIVGGESGGRNARPMNPVWARELRDAASARGIPLHFKQWGSWAPAGFVTGLRDGSGDTRVIAGDPEWHGAYYRGPGPKSSGKLLDGREWCEFPSTSARKSYEEALF